jgi:hypothetical protein
MRRSNGAASRAPRRFTFAAGWPIIRGMDEIEPAAAAAPRTTQRVGVNLQYLKPQLEGMVRRNRPTRSEVEVIDIGERMLMRVQLFGWHPRQPGEYIRVDGYGDRHWRAVAAAEQAWTDLHAEIFIAELVDAAEAAAAGAQ